MTNILKPESMGRHSYGDPIVKTWGHGGTKCVIGAFCSIAGNVQIFVSGNHSTEWITTFPLHILFDGLLDTFSNPGAPMPGDVIIGNDVWIGENVTIMSGSIIEHGCAIGAEAVIAGYIPAYSVVVGNPGKVIRKRFSDEQIKELLKIKWWDWPDEKIEQNARLLLSNNIQEFIDKHKITNV